MDRIRITYDVPDRVRRALNIVAAKRNKTVGEIIEELVLAAFPKELQDADEAIAEGGPAPKGKRGRKPST